VLGVGVEVRAEVGVVLGVALGLRMLWDAGRC
jgi:hypothetical protein